MLFDRGKRASRVSFSSLASCLPEYMNVLLADANIPHEIVFEIEDQMKNGGSASGLRRSRV